MASMELPDFKSGERDPADVLRSTVHSVAFVISDDSPRTNEQRLADAIESTLRHEYPDLMIRRLDEATDDAPGEWV